MGFFCRNLGVTYVVGLGQGRPEVKCDCAVTHSLNTKNRGLNTKKGKKWGFWGYFTA